MIGPFWITISTGVMVAAMGPLYGQLMGQSIASYFQHLACSMILWAFISGCINESGTTFTAAEALIKQLALPLSTHVFRLLARHLISLVHNLVIVAVVLLVLPPAHFDNYWLFPNRVCLGIGQHVLDCIAACTSQCQIS